MIKPKYIFVFFVLLYNTSFSQSSFNNLDSLLSKNFQTVNNRDSLSYLSLLDQNAIFTGKKVKNKLDSMMVLQPFIDSFTDLITNLEDMTDGADFTVKCTDYELLNNNSKLPQNGRIRLHANMIVNNTFSLKMPMVIVVKNSQYSIDTPMTVMFLESN